MSIEHRQREVDGVNVHHFPSEDAVTSAILTFGVGLRDETLPTGGALHLLEHLAMDQARHTPIEVNASVGPSLTEFRATGSPVRVAAFLETVCRVLAEPVPDRLTAEVEVLEAEEHSDGDDGVSPLAANRYGWRDLGLVGGPVAGPRAATPERVRALATRWFTTGNAVLVVDGPWPDGLRLPLTTAPPRARPPVPIRRFPSPHVFLLDEPMCGVDVLLPPSDDHRELMASTILRRRLEDELRHHRGLIYDLDVEMTTSGDGRWYLQIYVEPPPGKEIETARVLVASALSLLNEGCRSDEFERARQLAVEEGLGRAAEIGLIADAAVANLLGPQLSTFDPRQLQEVDHRGFDDYLRRAGGDVLFVLGGAAATAVGELGLEVFDGGGTRAPLPEGELFRPGLFARAVNREARASQVVLTSTGVAHRFDGVVETIDWADVVGAMRIPDDDIVVFGADGATITLGPGLYRQGRRLVEALERHVRPELVYTAAARWDERDGPS